MRLGRLRETGRRMPDGLRYIDSWIEASFDRCFQLMEAGDANLFQKWILAWSDLMEFEIVPVAPSKETRAVVEAALESPVLPPTPVPPAPG